MPEPRILAGFVQGTLDTVRQVEGRTGLRIAERLPAETVARVRKALPVSWLPLQLDVELTAALFDGAGTEEAVRVFRDAMAGSMDKSFLGPLVRGAVALLGRSPERLLRWAPKVWSAIYRDAGDLAVGPHPEGLVLEWLHAPRLAASQRDYLLGIAGAVEGALAALRIESQCRLEEPADDPTFIVRWKDPGSER